MGLTERIARACAGHPWLTLGAWGVALAGAIAALMLLMTGLTTEGVSTNNPESERAEDRLLAAFPSDPGRAVTDLVVVRSDSLTVDQPRFRAFVAELGREGRDTGAVAGARTFYATGDRSLVSADRDARARQRHQRQCRHDRRERAERQREDPEKTRPEAQRVDGAKARLRGVTNVRGIGGHE